MKTQLAKWIDAKNGVEVLIFVDLSDKLAVRMRDTDADENVGGIQSFRNMDDALLYAHKCMQHGQFAEVTHAN